MLDFQLSIFLNKNMRLILSFLKPSKLKFILFLLLPLFYVPSEPQIMCSPCLPGPDCLPCPKPDFFYGPFFLKIISSIRFNYDGYEFVTSDGGELIVLLKLILAYLLACLIVILYNKIFRKIPTTSASKISS